MNYYIIIPAHNEEAFIADTLNSVIAQSLLPKKVVVVNDNSTDNTQEIINQFSNRHSFITSVKIDTNPDHIPGSKVIYAFQQGLKEIDDAYDFIVKLDADVILPEQYFEKIAFIFSGHPEVGIAGGFIYEQDNNGNWKLNHPMNKKHVRGAIKSFSKTCFKAIGGLKVAMGWDTVDELLAQYHGFEIYTDPELIVKHLRPVGKNYDEKASLLQGEAMYSMRYGFWISIIASLKMAWKQRSIKVFQNNFFGYSKASMDNKPFLVNEQQGKFIRKLRWKNIKSKLF
ncbi:glycosyltransferase [Muriicola sp. Z0-33]|uniref:glycosyltransferase n=1 Tax=Muriicola sp. Z0-33 TaxID=2816957 RepID=UPI0022370F1E|nr:glycosyltransferase family 2 protein [Muriicola sp. Z0-33]MCW5516749.1 glycosyltransferase family 2 protein [Muriicola sp. Z0-33]